MALADFEPFRQEVTYRNKPVVSVRGLCLDDISVLIRAHLDSLSRLMSLAREKGEFGTAAFLIDMLTTAPSVAFDVIAMAADEPSYGEQSRKLPIGLQVKILQVITELSLEDMGGPKAAVALIQRLLPRSLLNQQATPSSASIASKDAA